MEFFIEYTSFGLKPSNNSASITLYTLRMAITSPISQASRENEVLNVGVIICDGTKRVHSLFATFGCQYLASVKFHDIIELK